MWTEGPFWMLIEYSQGPPIREDLLHLLLGKQRLKEVLPIGIIIFVLGEKRKLLPLSRLMTFLKEIIMSAAIIEGLCRYY